MSALFEEQSDDMANASSEAIVPVSIYEGMLIHHESIALKKLHEVVSTIGGATKGENTDV